MSKLIGTQDFFDKLIKLSIKQQELCLSYGLRQIKYMFDVDKILEIKPPIGAEIVGLSVFGRWVALDKINEIRYGYFGHNKTWSQANDYHNVKDFDLITDFQAIYNIFDLGKYDLNALTYVHNNFKERYQKWHEKQNNQ